MVGTALAALALAGGCGGDGEGPVTTPGAMGATGQQDTVAGDASDMTASEFIAELQPQKQEILEAYVADSEACDGIRVDGGFVLLVTAAAMDAGDATPIGEVIEAQC